MPRTKKLASWHSLKYEKCVNYFKHKPAKYWRDANTHVQSADFKADTILPVEFFIEIIFLTRYTSFNTKYTKTNIEGAYV